jgi:hypothetical protein
MMLNITLENLQITRLVGLIHQSTFYPINFQPLSDEMNQRQTKQKVVINELDVEERLISFPVELLENVNWISEPIDSGSTRKILRQIADDFLLGKQNSLGSDQMPIEIAQPVI